MKILLIISIFLLLSFFPHSTIIEIPNNQPTIQKKTDTAADTDTILVQSGTYVENINYYSKLIIASSLFFTIQDKIHISRNLNCIQYPITINWR
jgi:hypothetical protein